MVSFKNVCGIVLSILMVFSALLAIMGIWGMVEGSTIGLSYVADTFFSDRKINIKEGESKV